MKTELIKYALIIAGVSQIIIAILYPFIRHKVLFWFEDLKNLKPLNQAIAKTYGYYIQAINFSMGLLSITLYGELIKPTPLSIAIIGFIALYWIGRISFQIKSYSFEEISAKKNYTLGIWALNLLIVSLASIYLFLFIHLITL